MKIIAIKFLLLTLLAFGLSLIVRAAEAPPPPPPPALDFGDDGDDPFADFEPPAEEVMDEEAADEADADDGSQADETAADESSDDSQPISESEQELLDSLDENVWDAGQGKDAPPAPAVLPAADESVVEEVETETEIEPAPMEINPEESPATPPVEQREAPVSAYEEDPFNTEMFEAVEAPAEEETAEEAEAPAEEAVEEETVEVGAMDDEDPFGSSPFEEGEAKEQLAEESLEAVSGPPPADADAPPPPMLMTGSDEDEESAQAIAEEDMIGDDFMPGDFVGEEGKEEKTEEAGVSSEEDPFAGLGEPAMPPPGDFPEAQAAEAEESVAVDAPAAAVVMDSEDKSLESAETKPDEIAKRAWFYDKVQMEVDEPGKERVLAGSILLARARDLERRKRYYEAWRLYRDLVARFPHSKVARGALHGYYSRRLLARAWGLEQQKRYFEAAHTYRDAIMRNRDNARAWYRLGSIYHKYRKHREAVACFEEVLALRPEGNKALSDWLEVYKVQARNAQ